MLRSKSNILNVCVGMVYILNQSIFKMEVRIASRNLPVLKMIIVSILSDRPIKPVII